jgi:hypothetical protein
MNHIELGEIDSQRFGSFFFSVIYIY